MECVLKSYIRGAAAGTTEKHLNTYITGIETFYPGTCLTSSSLQPVNVAACMQNVWNMRTQ